MKKLNIIISCLYALFAFSCLDDKSSEGLELLSVVVSELDESYEVYAYRDVLKINPTVVNESQYDFFWTVYTSNFNVNAGFQRPDTISFIKELEYEVTLDPGQYYLVLNIKNKQTGVTTMKLMDLSVNTLNMSGWYFLKDNAGNTDFDFMYEGGRIDNWIAHYNNGQNLEGEARKAIFVPSMKPSPISSDLYNVLFVISDKDAATYNIVNGEKDMGFEDMFFLQPEVINPQNVLQPMNANNIVFINDNKMYGMVKGSRFSNPPISNYKISPIAGVGALVLAFDENTESFVLSDSGNSFPAVPSTGNQLKNMDANMVWIEGYAGLRSTALLLLRKESGEGIIAKLNASYGALIGSNNPATGSPYVLVQDFKTVNASHGLMNADVIGGNYDSDYIYFAKGNEVYLTNLANLSEELQLTLPVGETVTCMQHIKFPQPAAGVTYTVDCFAIASYINGKYKIWLHQINSIGNLEILSEPDFEGDGRVTCINYLNQGVGARIF